MNSFSLLPNKNKLYWDIYKRQMRAIWTTEEIDFTKDYNDFITLDKDKQHTVKMILSFFSNSDGLVNYNIRNNFLNDFCNEISYVYTFQMFMENIHNETYSLMIECLIKDEIEKNKLFDSINNFDIIKKISKWGLTYSDNICYTLAEKLLVFICFEGIMFSGAFAVIYWIKTYCSGGKMFLSGLIKSNELISRDEGMHVEFGIEVFKEQQIKDKVPNFLLTTIILECVSLTQEFNKEVLKVKQIGINDEMMNQYTEYIADRIFVSIGLPKQFNASNPFRFMDTIGMTQKTNFHESRPTEYQKNLNSNVDIIIDDDF